MRERTTQTGGEGREHGSRFVAPKHPPSTAIVEAVLELEGKEPEEVTPLYDVLDPDALDSLFDERGERGASLCVSFVYEGYSVQVHDDGRVRLTHEDDLPGATTHRGE